ncbi:unnamed protein product [Cuscuta campestris]|uniref:Reverse transcriptase Ty1/copia-type domain-containing protein n=1 Tax=Cuscuta campestris TaxID=132261 RepID=A0A484NC22_9ASTE|nr:unnamed protein product [Cuscuta campestris]
MLTGTVIHRSNNAGPLYPMSQTAAPAQAQKLKGEFAMTDMGDLNFFLGINVQHTAGGLFLHQTQFAHEILERADMLHCKPISTPVDTKAKLSATSGTPLPDPTIYRSIVGALQYLTFTRPDLTYVVQQLCLHLHAPRSSHRTAMKRVLRYIHGTATHGITLHRTGTDSLQAYSDADWAGCPDTRRSTSGNDRPPVLPLPVCEEDIMCY